MIEDVVVCADDYGLSPAIDDGILELAEQGRLSAVSCMTISPQWPAAAKRLAPLADRLDIGLHLTLVDEAPLTNMPHLAPHGRLPAMSSLIVASMLGRLDLQEIDREIAAQCEAFEAVMGRAPAHLDGHQHAHVLPGIRRKILARANGLSPRPWLRNVAEPMGRILVRGVAVPKAAVIATLARGFARDAHNLGLAVNDGFRGVYAFNPDADLAALYDRFLRRRSRRTLIMCHPAAASDPRDSISAARAREYQFLRSPEFPEILARHQCRVARMSATP